MCLAHPAVTGLNAPSATPLGHLDIIVDPKTTKEQVEAILNKVAGQSEFANVRLDGIRTKSWKG